MDYKINKAYAIQVWCHDGKKINMCVKLLFNRVDAKTSKGGSYLMKEDILIQVFTIV